ncbi:MAG: hypothetical protein AB4062_15080 [Crocosphaera sp.]
MELETKKISFKVVLIFTDKQVFSNTGKHLSNIESLVLQESLNGKKYPEIAAENGYTIEYLKNDVGPKLWRRLSCTFGEKVNKANVKIVITNRIYEEQETNQLDSVDSPSAKPQNLSTPIPIRESREQSISSATNIITSSSSDPKVKQLEQIAQVYFEKSLSSLRGKTTHKILLALVIFPNGALQETIIRVIGLENLNIFSDSLIKLKEMLLIEERNQKYCLLPLIRNYLTEEINDYPEWEILMRERWIDYYLEISQQQDSLIFDKEKENLLEMIDWCVKHNLHHKVQQLWPSIKSLLTGV